MKEYSNDEKEEKKKKYKEKLEKREQKLFHHQVGIKARYINYNQDIDKIKEDLLKIGRLKYYNDGDGKLRTTKGQFMVKKDIAEILNIYNNQTKKISKISQNRKIRFCFNRIKRLIKEYEKLKVDNGGNEPDDYLQ